jgi:hypothetical protein
VNYRINTLPVQSEIIGTIAGDTTIQYEFTGKANLSSYGFYTIDAWIDYPGDTYIANNTKTLKVRNQPVINQFPFIENFEKGLQECYAEGVNNSWELGKPSSVYINDAASGNNAWKTKLNGAYNTNEKSFVYSPCFDLSSLQNPIIALSYASQMENGFLGSNSDIKTFEYSTNGTTWSGLGLPGFGIISDPAPNQWRTTFTGNRRLIFANNKNVQFRFGLRSDSINNFDGLALDDIHVYDNTFSLLDTVPGNYETEIQVNGTKQWQHLLNNGRIAASMMPLSEFKGKLNLTTFIEPVRAPDFHGQYHLQRHYKLHGGSNKDSFLIRLFFTTAEAEYLQFGRNCPTCIKPKHVYRLGISFYSSDSTLEENNKIDDNTEGAWQFYDFKQIKLVPYEKGYYAEFKTSGHGEYWLNSGGLNNKSYLPVELVKLKTRKTGEKSADLTFTTVSQVNISRFEIEVARGNEAYRKKQFINAGTIKSTGRSAAETSYSFAENNIDKAGVQYYRIKTIDSSGNYSYSKSIPLIINDELKWKIFPNPSPEGQFKLSYQLNTGEKATLRVFTTSGMLIYTQEIIGSGFIQQTGINLDKTAAAKGVYILKITRADKEMFFKVTKS